MKVNDLIELLEYSASHLPVSVAVVGHDGTVVRYDAPRFLIREDRVYLVVDQRPSAENAEGIPTEEIVLSEYERPQIFGHHSILIRKKNAESSD